MTFTNRQGNFEISPKTLLLGLAFAAVYLIWGSTYLGIKYALVSLPPFILASTRFLVAGSVLFIAARFTKDFEWPRVSHWKTSFISGALLLLVGNGAVVLAQDYISSGLAALLVASEPFFVVILSWLWLGRGRPGLKVTLGLLIGFVGVALLIVGQPSANVSGGSGQTLGAAAVIIGALSWAVGSLYGLKAAVPRSAMLTSGMQMLAGGALMFIVSLVKGEWTSFNAGDVSAGSWMALAYLTVFGSIVAFTAYSWLLRNVKPSLVATYAYVNPVVAVFLGWGIAGEKVSMMMLAGAAIVVGSVALVSREKKSKRESARSDSAVACPADVQAAGA